ncbi:type IV pilus biogenesis/stability protein PilW [Oceanisphaera psychrotolerans]|uniref:Type IV pilus biogenesis/stability protein PilW n=1 Tax=Oceanisphaera psychrotolerans TaxID=1414654 RepID=A0A1J4QIG8_9GAMM|nr:type IV pilus biogenesis/stability protein PilW [Oceanisphaera psychrotolerans]OIN14426.1 type IV pilus biogenesis/stability protein PilW [Oceanisphaera psychrotolerans]
MRTVTLLPMLLMGTMLGGCVHETTYLTDGHQSRDVMFKPEDAALTRMNLGLEYLRRGNAGQAKYNLDRAVAQDPRNADVHLARAYFYQSVSDLEQAEKSYRQVLKLNPQHGDGLNNYGVFLCGRERFDEADVMFRRAVVSPGYVQVADSYENAAFCALQHDKPQAALEYFRRALEFSPARPKALLGSAELLVEQGDDGGASEYLARYRDDHQPSPQSLWLTVRTAEAQGSVAQAQLAGAELVRLFPDSEQARRFLSNDY